VTLASQRLESSRTGVAVTRGRSIPVLAAAVNRPQRKRG